MKLLKKKKVNSEKKVAFNKMFDSEDKKSDIKTTFKTLKFMLDTAWKQKKFLYFLYFLRAVSDALSELKLLLLPKLLMDELVAITGGAELEEHLHLVITYVVMTLVAELLSRVIGNIASSNISVCAEQLDAYFGECICDKAMGMDFEHTEDPTALDQRDKAQTGISWYSGGVIGILNCLYQVIYSAILGATVITVIAIYCPLLLPVQILSMLAMYYFNYKNQLINTEFFLKLAKSNRVFGYVLYELADFRYGKDVRMYDSADMMCERADQFADMQLGLWHEQASRQVKNSYGSNIANAVRDGFSYLYMGICAIKGIITLGEFTLCVSAASRLYQSLMGIGGNIQQIGEKCNYAYQFIVFMEYPEAKSKGTQKVKDGEHVIEFRDVSFKYPRAEEYVLEHVNITIRPNEHLSVVGLNGAGKTTFIKLLCRLYDVTDGEILIDGINIKDYSEEEYRKLFAVVFQDFSLFAFTLKENIQLGDVDVMAKESDSAHVEEVLKLSGLYEDAVKLEKGLDTVLFKTFDEKGTDLSGGQQQKTAISRALYKNAPIVILDEPTAALDPIAEYDIYRNFDTLVGNKSAIYISHRLSSCKFCDKIAVFADKTIKEYGTHDELLKLKDGIYSEMFNTQAQYYVENA